MTFFVWTSRERESPCRRQVPIELGFSTANGLPFDTVVYANPINQQHQVNKAKDFDVWIGTRVDIPPGYPNVQYMVPPNVQVTDMPGIPSAPSPMDPPRYSEIEESKF